MVEFATLRQIRADHVWLSMWLGLFLASGAPLVAQAHLPLVPGAALCLEVEDSRGMRVTEGTVIMRRRYAPESGMDDVVREIPLSEIVASGGLLYYEPRYLGGAETLYLSARTSAGEATGTLIVPNADY